MNRRFAFFSITFLALALFGRPLFRGEVLTFRDHGDYFQPLRYFTSEELRHFRLPLWNPYNASGEPWLANPQTAVFYPPAWIFLLLPFATAYVLYLLLHFILLGCGAFLLFSRFASASSAFIGSVILMLCGPTLSMLDVSNNLTTFAWIPLVLWCALAEAPAMASGAAIAMSFLAGEPFFAAAGALMFAIVRRKNVVDVAITAFCLAGIQLIPFLAMIVGSDRASGTVSSEEILHDSMSLADWLRVAAPAGTTHQQFIPTVYMGIVTVLLAIIGTFSRRARGWLLLLGASVLMSALMGAVLTNLPLMIIRYPARVVPLGALAMAALASIGWERARRALPFAWLPMAVVALIIADLVPRIAPLLESGRFDARTVPWARSIGRDGKIVRLMPPDLRVIDRRMWIAGYLNLFDRRFDAWTAAPMVSESYTRAYRAALLHRDLLDRMSIAYVLTSSPRGVVVHRNPAALPMAFWRDEAGRIVRASVLACTTSAVFVTIDAPADGLLIVTQRSSSGWDAEIDGAPVRTEGEGVFRAVRVHAGHHAIAWRYHPRSLMIGFALTIIAIARMLLSTEFVKRNWHEIFFAREENFS